MKDFYTVDDIALILRVTTRTVRNYLKDGSLKGRKIGGGWRFTEDDFMKFLSSAGIVEKIKDDTKQDVIDFLDGLNTDMSGEIQICTIIDVYRSVKAVEELRNALMRLTDAHGKYHFSFTYTEAEGRARFTLFGTVEYIAQAMEIINKLQ